MRSFFHLKNLAFSLVVFFSAVSNHSEASGWGADKKINEYENTLWQGVYFYMGGLNFTGMIPNYTGDTLKNDCLYLNGEIDDCIGYVITTSLSSCFTPPSSAAAFIEEVQSANPDYIVYEVTRATGEFAVDLVPNCPETTVFWRFICEKERLIKLGTNDTNPARIEYFFKSFKID